MYVSHHSQTTKLVSPKLHNVGTTALILSPCWANPIDVRVLVVDMMTSSNGNIFRVTGPLFGEFTGPIEFPSQRPVARSFDVFFDLRLNKRLGKKPWGWWFETPSWSLWRHRDGSTATYILYFKPICRADGVYIFHVHILKFRIDKIMVINKKRNALLAGKTLAEWMSSRSLL